LFSAALRPSSIICLAFSSAPPIFLSAICFLHIYPIKIPKIHVPIAIKIANNKSKNIQPPFPKNLCRFATGKSPDAI